MSLWKDLGVFKTDYSHYFVTQEEYQFPKEETRQQNKRTKKQGH